jgi:YfiH family protein
MIELESSVVKVPGWERYAWLRHGFSTRQGGVSRVYGGGEHGDLNLGFTGDDDPDAVRENRRRFAAEAGRDDQDFPLIAVRQVHGTEVKVVREGETGLVDQGGRGLIEADGLMTAAAGVILAVQVADCVPVLVVDTRQRVVAALHAGWRGTVAGMVARAVDKMEREFGSEPDDMIAAVGPSIGPCCYEVGEEVRAAFEEAYGDPEGLFRGRNLNLWEANRRQFGLPPGAVSIVGECTGCTLLADGRRKYFSHRMEHGFTGRAMGVVGVVRA